MPPRLRASAPPRLRASAPPRLRAYDPDATGEQPATFDRGRVSNVHAARIDDKTLHGRPARRAADGLLVGIGAITHDKIRVIDLHDAEHGAVVLGRDNLCFKTSYRIAPDSA